MFKIYSSFKPLLAATLFLGAFGVQPSNAAYLPYTIKFTGENPPTAGSFLYDSNATNNTPFLDFIITWESIPIDFTGAANVFDTVLYGPTCEGVCPELFAMLSGEYGPTSWFIFDSPDNALPVLTLSGGPQAQWVDFVTQVTYPSTGGGYSISASTPEPPACVLFLAGLVSLTSFSRYRNRPPLRNDL